VRSDFPGTQDTRVIERSVAKKQGEVKPRRVMVAGRFPITTLIKHLADTRARIITYLAVESRVHEASLPHSRTAKGNLRIY